MGVKKISINDIAKHFQIAKSTVSFIINGKAEERRISKELEKRVLGYVEEIGFKPHYLARSLATGKSNSIGLIVENIGDSFFGPIALKIEERAKSMGYRVVYSSTLGNTQEAIDILKLFRETQVDGYIIVPPVGMEEAVEEVMREGKPVVVFDRMLDGVQVDYIGTNNQEITYAACMHLVEEGFKNIGFVTLDSSQSQMVERLNGYKQAIDQNNGNEVVLSVNYCSNRSDYKNEIKQFLQEHQQVDALFFATNYLCVAGLETLRDLQKHIPEDIGVAVFDENDLFRLFDPAITTIEQPLEDLSKAIFQTLQKRILRGSNRVVYTKKIIPSRLIVRQSTIRRK